jgi:short-subunit dehydrogenase
MREGGAIINTASINSEMPNPTLPVFATTKGAIQNVTAGLVQLLAKKAIRVNAVSGPVWIPHRWEADPLSHNRRPILPDRPPATMCGSKVLLR